MDRLSVQYTRAAAAAFQPELAVRCRNRRRATYRLNTASSPASETVSSHQVARVILAA